MVSPLVDAPLLEHTGDLEARPLPPRIDQARVDVRAAAGDLARVPDARLEIPWQWRPVGEEAVRYGFYRILERIEEVEILARESIAWGTSPGRACGLIAPATAARWDLQGLLDPLATNEWDADPGGSEWTIRQTLGHVINGQRAYGWGTAWWQTQSHRPDDPDLPEASPKELWATLPDETTDEVAGSLDDVRQRLDTVLDLAAERLAGLPSDRLGYGARWSGFAVDIGFRLGRWSSHIREHTVQVDKTLLLLGRQPSEVDRLVRLIFAAWGRAEAAVFGQPQGSATNDAAVLLAAAAVDARDVARSVRSVAEG